ncbi:betaine/proline/choline family ABC transporter ATP-binding protein [Hoeflea olei]|uniref:betaine/proline/choline family ABC transporter ATP-binding protein n=1 Tax=Hoeflea olei TaxID=1480615 RepID=UPI0008260461
MKVENVSKLFNDKRGEGLSLLKQGRAKDEIFRDIGVTVGIDNVSFEVNEGEIFVIMGLSGSGKSTLVRTLNGLIKPTMGKIMIGGDDVASCDAKRLREIRRREITMVFQHFALFPHKTVAENVAFGLRVRGLGKDERRQAAIEALARVGLQDHADSMPDQLSGGMQQRVGLARGLATDPEILLMDEPFGALDPLIRREMQDELIVLQKELKKTIIFITHDLNEALLLGDRIAIMKDGAFVQVGTAQDIVSHPADDYVRAFVADVDRSRVFTASDIAKDADHIPVHTKAIRALAVMDKAGVDLAHVVDAKEMLVGAVTRETLEAAKPDTPVADLMDTDVPSVSGESYINEMYTAAQSGAPIAVTDEDGKFVGSIEPASIFGHLASDESAGDDEDGTADDALPPQPAAPEPLGSDVRDAKQERPNQ